VAGDIVWIIGKFEQLPHIERKKRIDPLVLGETNQALAENSYKSTEIPLTYQPLRTCTIQIVQIGALKNKLSSNPYLRKEDI
jgi:hypothetical protein